jgi:hypothetical protein
MVSCRRRAAAAIRTYMNKPIALELRKVCVIAGWDDVMVYAGDDTVSVRPDGEVVLMHEGKEVLVGTLTAEQLRGVVMSLS